LVKYKKEYIEYSFDVDTWHIENKGEWHEEITTNLNRTKFCTR
jgi:hypothetical protein